MNKVNLISTRRSQPCHPGLPVKQEDIEVVLQAGCWAPTHKKSEPWRFTIFQGEGRQKLQAAWCENAAKNGKNVETIATKAFRAPVIITVWCAVGRGDKPIPVWEEEAATAACCQNMLLAAEDLNLAAIWRTGGVGHMPEVQSLIPNFDITKGDRIIGFIYLGQKDSNRPTPTRDIPNWANKTTWIG
ncbi:MAG: nitroreductase [Alphaproteobacteria bacterium]|nr:nitroreductase [Alphaproteobacteria bacterium]MDD9919546.1 nitroreductase [Alphaproteobacteria bacterium]